MSWQTALKLLKACKPTSTKRFIYSSNALIKGRDVFIARTNSFSSLIKNLM